MTPEPATQRMREWPWVAAALGAAVVALAAVAAFILRHHSIKAWSDPVNWLTFARDFAAEFRSSRFACGYPIFLRLILPLTGPFGVFLSNLPLVLLVMVQAGWLAARALPDARPAVRAAAAAVTVALLAAADAHVLLTMANPYRDPLSHALLLASLLMVAKRADGQRPSPAASFVAGLVFGLAFTVREPALITALPIGVLLLWVQRSRPEFALPRWIGWAAAGAALGAAPLVVQGMVRAGGSAPLPPQSIAEGRLMPGLHWAALAQTGRLATAYFSTFSGVRPLIPILWAIGLVGSALARRRRALCLLAIPAGLYSAFYSFYWTFVPRYFWIALVFGAATAGWLVGHVADRLTRRRSAWLAAALPVLVAVSACGALAAWLARIPTPSERFTIHHARRLATAVERIVPANAHFLAPRPFCEIVRWFNRLDAWPASWLWEPGVADPSRSLRRRLAASFDGDRPVLAGELRLAGRRDIEFSALRRAFSSHRLESLDLEPYGLGRQRVTFWRLEPWTATQQEWTVYSPLSNCVLQIDAGPLDEPAELQVDGAPPMVARPGANFVALPRVGDFRVRLHSTVPVPRLPVRILAPDEPLLLDFDVSADVPCLAWLADGFRIPPYGLAAPVVERTGDIRLPTALPGNPGPRRVRLRVRATEPATGSVLRFAVGMAGNEWELAVRMDRRFHELDIGPATPPAGVEWTCRIRVIDPGPDRGLEVESIAIASATDG